MLSHTNSRQHTRYLLRLSLALYFFSLFLPAYGEHLFDIEGEHYYFGIEVLLFGLLFGWLGLFGEIGALAAYANLFYAFAMYQAYKKGTMPIKSTVITLVLSLLSFLNREYTGDKGVSFGDYISIWGWGSVLWFFAIGVLVDDTTAG